MENITDFLLEINQYTRYIYLAIGIIIAIILIVLLVNLVKLSKAAKKAGSTAKNITGNIQSLNGAVQDIQKNVAREKAKLNKIQSNYENFLLVKTKIMEFMNKSN